MERCATTTFLQICLKHVFILIFILSSWCLRGSSSIQSGSSLPDCNHQRVISNFQRMCMSYAYLKRSPHVELLHGEYGNEIGQWPGRDNRFNLAPMQQGPWWWYVKIDGGGAGGAGAEQESGNDKQLPQERLELDPIYSGVDEELAIVARWRRNRELERVLGDFIKEQCCLKGCPFPTTYLEVDRKTNICNLR